MARKKKDSLSAFDTALDEFGFSNSMSQEEVTNINDVENGVGIDNPDDEDEDHTDVEPNVEDNNSGGNFRDDDSEIPDNILNTPPASNLNDNDNQDNEPVNQNETQQVGMFFDAFAEELGWEVNDDEKPNSVSDLIDYIEEMVAQNSVPQYSDNRIAQLDEYVRNGGKFEDFYARQQEAVSYDNLNMEDESNQKAAVRDYLRYQGYNDDQINRKIERYEDGDMLEEEAQDAIARLTEINERQLEATRRQQEEQRREQEQQAQQFMNNLTNTITSLDNIRGISIPKADRKELFDYITKVDADGLTKYQKDFNANMVNNLIESAYFTMKGDALLGEAKKSGRTSAANKLRTMLRHSSTNHSRYNVNDDKQRSVVDIASQFYR